jgi:hypothetical protein
VKRSWDGLFRFREDTVHTWQTRQLMRAPPMLPPQLSQGTLYPDENNFAQESSRQTYDQSSRESVPPQANGKSG